jgi:nucleotide-binding universal stress UspA family protein
MVPKHLLVPVDFSEPSSRAVDYAMALARETRAKVTLLHAFELPIVGFPDGALVASAEIASRLVSSAQSALSAELEKRKKEGGVVVDSVLKQSDPRDAIVSAAKELGADLIVMGTHGRRGFARALLGSVAESVLRTAPVPVLVVRAPKE